jgi:hypothetical protein
MTRSNSGRDKGRNNLHDPTTRDRELGRDVKKGALHGRTTEMGSRARKTGQKGAGSHR